MGKYLCFRGENKILKKKKEKRSSSFLLAPGGNFLRDVQKAVDVDIRKAVTDVGYNKYYRFDPGSDHIFFFTLFSTISFRLKMVSLWVEREIIT